MAPTQIQAEQTVGDVAHRHAGTLEVMKRMGINHCCGHCCGAQLTLTQAAAAAGVSIGALLEALNEARTALSS